MDRRERQPNGAVRLAIALVLVGLGLVACGAPAERTDQIAPTPSPESFRSVVVPRVTPSAETLLATEVPRVTPSPESLPSVVVPSTVTPLPTRTPAPSATARVATGAGHLVYTTRWRPGTPTTNTATSSGHRNTLWLAGADGRNPIELASSTNQDPQVLISSDHRVLLARVIEEVSGSEPQYVLYALSPDWTSRQELGRGFSVVLLDEYRSNRFSEMYYRRGIPSSTVDRSLTGDGKSLWFSVMGKPGGRPSAYPTVTWYSWNVETRQTREVFRSKPNTAGATNLADTSADLSKALFYSGASLSNTSTVLSLLDPATGSLREVASVAGKRSTRPLMSPDGTKALVLGSNTTLVDLATGKQTDLKVADTTEGILTPDGQKALLLRQPSREGEGWELVIVDLAQGVATPVQGPLFNNGLSAGIFPFIPGTTLVIMESIVEAKQTEIDAVDWTTGAVQQLVTGIGGDRGNAGLDYLGHSRLLAIRYEAGLMRGPSGDAVEKGKTGEGNPSPYDGRLLVVDPRDPARRFELKGEYSSVVESPDGKRVAAVLQTANGQKSTLMAIDLAGGAASVELATGPQILDVSFSPDGTKVAYTEQQGDFGPWSIHVLSLDGKTQQLAIPGAALQAWLP